MRNAHTHLRAIAPFYDRTFTFNCLIMTVMCSNNSALFNVENSLFTVDNVGGGGGYNLDPHSQCH